MGREPSLADLERDLSVIKTRVDGLKAACPLTPYKSEMNERCKRMDDATLANRDEYRAIHAALEKEVGDVESRGKEKAAINRILIGRLISSLIVLGVALVSVIGAIQMEKVGREEFIVQIQAAKDDKIEAAHRFESFMQIYRDDRETRDMKIEGYIVQQLDFNRVMVENNSLLKQQLEVLKERVSH